MQVYTRQEACRNEIVNNRNIIGKGRDAKILRRVRIRVNQKKKPKQNKTKQNQTKPNKTKRKKKTRRDV